MLFYFQSEMLSLSAGKKKAARRPPFKSSLFRILADHTSCVNLPCSSLSVILTEVIPESLGCLCPDPCWGPFCLNIACRQVAETTGDSLLQLTFVVWNRVIVFCFNEMTNIGLHACLLIVTGWASLCLQNRRPMPTVIFMVATDYWVRERLIA